MNLFELLLKLKKLKNIDKLSRNELEELKLHKLRKLLSNTYKKSVYYRKIFDEMNINEEAINNFQLDDLKKIPIITKEQFIENYEDIVTDRNIKLDDVVKFDDENNYADNQKKLYLDKYHIIHTSGTEDKPFYVIYDKNAWEETVFGIIRIALWDLRLKELLKYVTGKAKVCNLMSSGGRYAGCTSIADGLEILNIKYKSIDVASELRTIKDELISFNPNILIGYVSILEIVADYIMDNGIKLNVDRVITCGEPLTNSKREKLEKIFNVKIIDCYGASESIAIGVQNDISEGMYILDDLNIVEIDKDVIYLTNLNNLTMPFIRYEIKDVLVKKDYDRDSKYPYSRIEKVRGRSSDILWLDNKKDFIHPLQIEGYKLKGMNDFQLVKTSEKSFVVNVKMDDIEEKFKKEYFTEIEKRLSGILKEILEDKKLNDINFEICEVDNMQIDLNSKKKRFIINDAV